MSKSVYDWAAIAADPKYCALRRRKSRLLALLLLLAVACYFMLPLAAALLPEMLATRISGPVNLGLVFALAEFAVVFGVAVTYSACANRDFDRVAAEINRMAFERYRRPR